MTPPAVLLRDCVETATAIDRALADMAEGGVGLPVTNADLVYKIRQLRVDLRSCNADKAALRAWEAAMR